jgi:hypothetical protein
MTAVPVLTTPDISLVTTADAPAVVMSSTATPDVYHVALIINGIVEDVLTCPARLAAILLSSPKIVEIAGGPKESLVGWTYDDVNNQIIPPAVI